MDNNEAFEKWHSKKYKNRDYRITNYGYLHQTIQDDYEIWQAAQQQSAGEIAEYKKALKAALEEKDQARHDEELAYKHYHELKADKERLREALSDTNTRFNEMVDVFYKGATAKDRAVIANNYELLSATTQSLQAHDEQKGK